MCQRPLHDVRDFRYFQRQPEEKDKTFSFFFTFCLFFGQSYKSDTKLLKRETFSTSCTKIPSNREKKKKKGKEKCVAFAHLIIDTNTDTHLRAHCAFTFRQRKNDAFFFSPALVPFLPLLFLLRLLSF